MTGSSDIDGPRVDERLAKEPACDAIDAVAFEMLGELVAPVLTFEDAVLAVLFRRVSADGDWGIPCLIT